jgi:amino acid adenylation domain-containing protein
MPKTDNNKITLPVQLLDIFTQYKDKPAIEYGQRILKYRQLDKKSNDIANWIIEKGIPRETFIGVLAGDRIHFICAMMGILKAGCAFVPLDPANPPGRLEKMIENIELKFLFIDRDYHAYSRQDSLQKRNIEFIEIENVKECQYNDGAEFINNRGITYTHEDKIYVYFTSGSTGVPKAIVGRSKSLLHYCQWEIETFEVGKGFRISQFATTSDAFLKEVFVTFLSGATLCIPEDLRAILNPGDLRNWVETSRVHMVHCVPHVFRVLGGDQLSPHHFPLLKYLIMSGETVYPADLKNWYQVLDGRIQLVNLYGTTETTILNTYYFIQSQDVNRERIPIGKPMKGNRIIILDEHMNICNRGIAGEIYIRTPYRSYGYYNDQRLNQEKFIQNPFNNKTNDLLYKTGDLGRFLPDDNIELLGRIDRQVKIRGHRLELAEIESALISHPSVKEAVVIKKMISDNNEMLLAYIVGESEDMIPEPALVDMLKEYLSKKLPEYMVPSYIVKMNHLPRTPNRKIDYHALPNPLEDKEKECKPPSTDIEKKIVDIWCAILKVEKIGVDDNFFKVGGHSLNVMNLSYEIHREFDVRLPLGEIFKNPTIEKQAAIIKREMKDIFIPIMAVEEREYYPLSSAQKRLFIVQQMAKDNINYNLTTAIILEGSLDRKKLENSFRKLIKRHESLRTGFFIVGNMVIQKIYKDAAFEIEYDETQKEKTPELLKGFIRPFDLSQAPLLRVRLNRIKKTAYFLSVDLHHIISDGTSINILIEDFVLFYREEDLPPVRIQYKDYAQWQNKKEQQEKMNKQEEYWLKQFDGEIPALKLPYDYERQRIKTFEGDRISFKIVGPEVKLLNAMALEEDSTLYMVLLAIFNVFLAKLSDQEDIIVGTGTAGRNHAHLQLTIGMFVNMLAIRNYPRKDKSFREFLKEVREKTLEVFENQDYQFEKLVERVGGKRSSARHPIFDVTFIMQNVEKSVTTIPGLRITPYKKEDNTSKFDIILDAFEKEQDLIFIIEYCTHLFKKETIEKFIGYFKKIVSSVLENPGISLGDIDIISKEERGMLAKKIRNEYSILKDMESQDRVHKIEANFDF